MKLKKGNGLLANSKKLKGNHEIEVEMIGKLKVIGTLSPSEMMFHLTHYKESSWCCETNFRFRGDDVFIQYSIRDLFEVIDILGEPADKKQVRKILNSNEETKEE
jgi:hypothetical protein